jgi:hypothetical protein
MNSNDECVKKYHEQLRNLCEETSEVILRCQYSLYANACLNSDIHADILTLVMEQEEYNSLQSKLDYITLQAFCKELKEKDKIKNWNDLTDEEKKEWLED